MKVRFLKLRSWLLVTLLGVLGFGSCRSHKQCVETPEPEAPQMREREEIRLMYGTPTMNFMIRGQVKDPDGQPVRGIHVNMLERGMEVKEGELQGDPERVRTWLADKASVTDGEGRFEIKESGLPQEEVRLMVRDTDGKANGDYRNQVVEIKVRQADVDREGAGGWNQGTFKKEVEIKLEDK